MEGARYSRRSTGQPLRILFLSTSYPQDASDWRGVFMAHISAALARQPAIRLIQWAPPGQMDPRVESGTTSTDAAWLSRLMRQGGISHRLRANPISGTLAAIQLLHRLRSAYRRHTDVDLYHINWLQPALPLPDNGKPALVTVLGNDMQLLRLPFMRGLLRRALRNRRAVLCPNATWMEPQLREEFGDLADVVPVPFGIDPRWYAIHRDPVRPPCWLVVTRLTVDKLGPLFEWSAPLFEEHRRELHLFGPMQEQVAIPPWIHYHGSAAPVELARDWFPQAHGLISLSRHAEGRPQVILEAMAAGLPVVASGIPAHVDLVDALSGCLCGNRDEFAGAITLLEDELKNRAFGLHARERVRREFGTWDDCAARFIALYRRLTDEG
jgi:glycosyltransferase involved in cell wall biosynthesis